MIPEQLFNNSKKILIHDEGLQKKVYTDSTGNVSIGIGRNLTSNGISDKTVNDMFCEDFQKAYDSAKKIFPDFDGWNEPRQIAIISMIFNLGEAGFKKFKSTISAIKRGAWKEAAHYAKESLWAKQVGTRSDRIVHMLRTAEFHPKYNV